MSKNRWSVALAALFSVLVAGAACAPWANAATATPPAPPAVGQLGGPGPCLPGTGMDTLDGGIGFNTITALGNLVWVFAPTGGGAPRTGGLCNDAKRPVVFIAHGAGALTPFVYGDLIRNMVSNGNIVVYANQSLAWAPGLTYPQVDAGNVQAAGLMNSLLGGRMDLSNIGIWGHSSGGGMVPWLAQQAEKHGWGRSSMWLQMTGMYFAFKVGTTGPIHLPANARVQVVAFDQDDKSDAGIGIDAFESFDIPDSQKDHITVRSDVGFTADHFVPVSWMLSASPADHLDRYGLYRNYQAMADCARFGRNCNADLGFMGTWSDGHQAPRAVVSDNPVDVGPPALDDCTYFASANLLGTPHLCKK